jgi:hypothetical protein
LLWLKLQWKKEPLNLLNKPEQLFQEGLAGIPTLFIWKASGVYKIIIQPGSISLSGNQQQFMYIPSRSSESLTFTYHGIKEKISMVVGLTGKDVTIHSQAFPEKIPLSQLKMGIHRDKILDFDRLQGANRSLLLFKKEWIIQRPLLKMPIPEVNFNIKTINIPNFK